MLATNDLTTLRSNDQLAQVRSAKQAFAGYDEGWLGFHPTYKFDKTRYCNSCGTRPLDPSHRPEKGCCLHPNYAAV